jgi:hypothetical protein
MQQFLTPADFVVLKRFLSMAIPRLQGLALRGLQLGLRRVADIWSDLARALNDRDGRTIAGDLLGNVIFSLENSFPRMYDD